MKYAVLALLLVRLHVYHLFQQLYDFHTTFERHAATDRPTFLL
jgi:hypothetical protein